MQKIKKLIPRQVVKYVESGGGVSHLPGPYARPEQLDRSFIKEVHAHWKVVCSCGKEKLVMDCDIGKLSDEVDNWDGHEGHVKYVFFKKNAQYHFRGKIPASAIRDKTGE